MSTLCYATFAKTLQARMCKNKSNDKFAELLLGYVIDCADIRNKNNETYTMDSSFVSGLMNQKTELGDKFKYASELPAVVNGAEEHFENKVVPCIMEKQRTELIDELLDQVEADESIGKANKAEFKSHANEEQLSLFLSEIFLYILGKPNCTVPGGKRGKPRKEETQLAVADGASSLGVPPEQVLAESVNRLTMALYATTESEASLGILRTVNSMRRHKP